MIRDDKLKRTITYNAVSQQLSHEEIHRVTQNHVEKRSRVFGYWTDDWLTAWQTRHEE